MKNEEDVEKLQKDLDTTYEWEMKNNMKFNGEKFLVLRYGQNGDLKENTSYFTADMNEVITQANECRDLGIIMQDDAGFSSQINKVCRKVRQKGEGGKHS